MHMRHAPCYAWNRKPQTAKKTKRKKTSQRGNNKQTERAEALRAGRITKLLLSLSRRSAPEPAATVEVEKQTCEMGSTTPCKLNA
jgi:hypothetical protein